MSEKEKNSKISLNFFLAMFENYISKTIEKKKKNRDSSGI